MKPAVKWAGVGAAALLGLGVAGLAYIYIASEMIIGRNYPLPSSQLTVVADADTIARGHRIAQVYGCANCHGEDLRGRYIEDFGVWSRNLTLLAKTHSDADFDRIVRHGLRPDGTSTSENMPADSFQYMPDEDMAAIIAYIRSLPVGGAPPPEISYSLAKRYSLLTGAVKMEVDWFAGQLPALDLGPQHRRGRELAMTACGECHTTALGGEPGGLPGSPPDLAIVASYDRADFFKLMRTGKAAGNRELKLMSDTARGRFGHFTDDELGALYDYLAARGQKVTGAGG